MAMAKKKRKQSDFILRCFFKSLRSVQEKTKMLQYKRKVVSLNGINNVRSSVVMNSNAAGDVRAKQDRGEGW